MENFSDEAQPKHSKKKSKKYKQKTNLLFTLEEKNLLEQLGGEVEYATHSITASNINSLPESTHKKHRLKKNNFSSSDKNIFPKRDIYIEEKSEEKEPSENVPKYPTSSFIIYKKEKEKENDNELLSTKHKYKKLKSPFKYNNDIEQNNNNNDIYISDYTNNNNFPKARKISTKKIKNLEIKKKLKKIMQKKLSGKYLKIFYYNKWFTITYDTPGGDEDYEIFNQNDDDEEEDNTKYKLPKTKYNPGMAINKYLVENEEIEQEEEENEFNDYKKGDLEEIEERPVDEEESVVTSAHGRGGTTARSNNLNFALRKILKYKNKFYPYFMKWKKGRGININVPSAEYKKLRKGKKIAVPHKNNSNNSMGSNINTPIPEDENEEYTPHRIKNVKNNIKNFILLGGSKNKILRKYYDKWYKKTFYENKSSRKKDYVFPYLKQMIDNNGNYNSDNKSKKNNQVSIKNKTASKEKGKILTKSKTSSKLINIENNNDDVNSSITSKDSLKKRKIKKKIIQDAENNNISYDDYNQKYKINTSENASLNNDSNDNNIKITKVKNKKKIIKRENSDVKIVIVDDTKDEDDYVQGLQKKHINTDENNEILEKIKIIKMNHLNNKLKRYLLLKRQKIKKIKHNDFQKKLYKFFLKTICRKNPLMLCFDKWFDETFKITKKYLPFSKNNFPNKLKTSKSIKPKSKRSSNDEEDDLKIHYKLDSKEPLSQSYIKKSKNKHRRKSSSPLLFGETNNEKIKPDKKKLNKDNEKIKLLIEAEKQILENNDNDLLFKNKYKNINEEEKYYPKNISESWSVPRNSRMTSKKRIKTKEKSLKKQEPQEEAPRQRKPGKMQISKEEKNEDYKSFNNTDKDLKFDWNVYNDNNNFNSNRYDDKEEDENNYKYVRKLSKSDDIPITKSNINNENNNYNIENYLRKREINYSKAEEINPDVQNIEIMQDEDEINNENQEYENNRNELIKRYKNAMHLLRKAIKCYTKRMKKTFNPDFATKLYFYKWVKITFEEGLIEYRKKKEIEKNNNKEITEQEKLNSLKNIFSMIRTHQKKLRRDLTEDQENEKYKKWAFDKWYENMTISNFKHIDSKESKDIDPTVQIPDKKEDENALSKLSNENNNKKEQKKKINKPQQEIFLNRSSSVPFQKTFKSKKKKIFEFEGEGLLEINDDDDYEYEYKKMKKSKHKKLPVNNEENSKDDNNNSEIKETMNKNKYYLKEKIQENSPIKEKIKETFIINENEKKYPIKENEKNYNIKENEKNYIIKENEKNLIIKENLKNYPIRGKEKYYPIKEVEKYFPNKENEKNLIIKENENSSSFKENEKNLIVKENENNSSIKEKENNSSIKEIENNSSIKENQENCFTKKIVKNYPIKENNKNYLSKENEKKSLTKENEKNLNIKENENNYFSKKNIKINPINENEKNYHIKENVKNSSIKEDEKKSSIKENEENCLTKKFAKNYPVNENYKNDMSKENEKNASIKENGEKYLTKKNGKNSSPKENRNNNPTKEIIKKTSIKENDKNSSIKETENNNPVKEIVKKTSIKEKEKNTLIKENENKNPIKEIPSKTSIKEKEKNSTIKENEKNPPIKENEKSASVKENENNNPIKENENKNKTKEIPNKTSILETENNNPIKEIAKKTPIKKNEKNISIKENENNNSIKEKESNNPIKENEKNASIKENENNNLVKGNENDNSIKENEKNSIIKENENNNLVKGNDKNSIIKENENNNNNLTKGNEKNYPTTQNENNDINKENEKNSTIEKNAKNSSIKDNENVSSDKENVENKEKKEDKEQKINENTKKQHDFFQRLKNEFSMDITDNLSSNYLLNDKYDHTKEEELLKLGSTIKVLPPPQVMALQKKNNQISFLPQKKKTYSSRRLKTFGHGKIENVEPGELVSSSRLFVIKEILKEKLNTNLKKSKSSENFPIEKKLENFVKFSSFMQKHLKNFDKIHKRYIFNKWNKMISDSKIFTLQSAPITPIVKQKKKTIQPMIFLTKSIYNNNEEDSKEINDKINDNENKINDNKSESDKNPSTVLKKAKIINLNKNIYVSNKRNYEINNVNDENETEEFKNELDPQEQLKENNKNDNNLDKEKISPSNENQKITFTVTYLEKNKNKSQKNDYSKIPKLNNSIFKMYNNMFNIMKSCNFAGKLNDNPSNFDEYISYLEEQNKKMKIYQLYYLYVLFNENKNFYILRKTFNKWKLNNKIFSKNISKNHINSIAVKTYKNILQNEDKIKCIFQDNDANLNCDCMYLLVKLKKILIRYQFMKELNPIRFYFYLWFKETFGRVISIDLCQNELEL